VLGVALLKADAGTAQHSHWHGLAVALQFQTFTGTSQTKFLLSKVCFALSEKWTLWCEIVELIDSLVIMSLFSVGTSSTE
jgi:hypothetical protein